MRIVYIFIEEKLMIVTVANLFDVTVYFKAFRINGLMIINLF